MDFLPMNPIRVTARANEHKIVRPSVPLVKGITKYNDGQLVVEHNNKYYPLHERSLSLADRDYVYVYPDTNHKQKDWTKIMVEGFTFGFDCEANKRFYVPFKPKCNVTGYILEDKDGNETFEIMDVEIIVQTQLSRKKGIVQ